MLGVNGVSIICHGISSPRAIRNAILVAENFVTQRVNDYIENEINSKGLLGKTNEADSRNEAESVPA